MTEITETHDGDFEFSGLVEALGEMGLIVEGLRGVDGADYEAEIGARGRETGEMGRGEMGETRRRRERERVVFIGFHGGVRLWPERNHGGALVFFLAHEFLLSGLNFFFCS